MCSKRLKRFLLIYASQTGQAQAIADEIAEKAPQHGLEAEVHCVSLTEKRFWLEREKLAVIVTSTTGDGDPPDTATKFWRRLKKKTLSSDHLAQLRFTLLGLGDSNYSNFCNCGKMMNARLQELGAVHFYNPAWADDAVGLELTVDDWIDGLWDPLKRDLEYITQGSLIQNGIAEENPQQKSPVNGFVHNDAVKEINGIVSVEDTRKFNFGSEDTSDIKEQELNTTRVGHEKTSVKYSQDSLQTNRKDQSDLKTLPQTKNTTNSSGSNDGEGNAREEKESIGIKHIIDGPKKMESLIHSLPPLSESALNLPAVTPAFIQINFNSDQSLEISSLPLHNNCVWPSAKTDVSLVTVLSCTQLTAEDAVKKTLKLTLDISECAWEYEPGDTFGIICPNSDTEVELLLARLKCVEIADQVLNLTIMEGTKKKNPTIPDFVSRSATLRYIFTHCYDIRAVPKKAFLRYLVEQTSNASEKRRLQELCSRQGSAQYTTYIREPNLSLLDVLEAFPSCCPSLGSLLEHLPRLQARPYSIASFSHTTPGKVSCVFNVIEIPAGSGRAFSRSGLCTGWLNNLTQNMQKRGEKSIDEQMCALNISDLPKVHMFLRKSTSFHLPEDPLRPIIMIGPGTGVAPFIGFLQKREWLEAKGTSLGEAWLFYGCRNREKDFLFKEDLERYAECGVLTRLGVCFSRDCQDENEPRYVQDNIKLNAESVVRLLDEGAIVYVCGDAKGMAKDVLQTFSQIVSDVKGITIKEAEGYMMEKKLHKQYLEDVWA